MNITAYNTCTFILNCNPYMYIIKTMITNKGYTLKIIFNNRYTNNYKYCL